MNVKNSPSGLNSTYVQCAPCVLGGGGEHYEWFGQIFDINL